METTIAALGGVGLFLLGMMLLTDGLKGLAGSSLRTVLAKAAATPLSGTFWGAVVTLLVQSSSATTMTTIGLVSAGLLTFTQGLGLVFGANIGTTGTGWLVALIGVRVSLSSYALPMIFVGALTKLLAGGRIAAAGGALAGFALVLYGLSTLQQGMGGLAEQLHPDDLPAVLGAAGVGWLEGTAGLLSLVAAGLVMTTLMQSSTAAIAVTLSAYYAGAISLDQGCALVIGQNIGTATSSAMAAIGASVTAKRLAAAYCMFKLIAAAIALALFPLVVPWMTRLAADGTTLLAAYHTAYNVIGVAVLLPLIDRFTALVERLLPEKRSPLTRGLEPASLASPVVAIEAARRTIALSLAEIARSVEAALTGGKAAELSGPAGALREVRAFVSQVNGAGGEAGEEFRFSSTLYALDYASRFAEAAGETPADGASEAEALCVAAMRDVVAATDDVAREAAFSPAAAPIEHETSSAGAALAALTARAQELAALRRSHRAATLAMGASGAITADEAIARVEAVLRLDDLVRLASRACGHLLGHPELSERDGPQRP